MAGTYTKLYFHVVFSTKHRKPFIHSDLEGELQKYIAGTIRNLGGSCIEINGTSDHVHLLILLPPKLALSDVLRDIKANSSKWIHEKFPLLAAFGWQDGFSAFSVSTSQVPDVIDYIRNQKDHHKERDFKAELLTLLQRHGVEYDERYLWDYRSNVAASRLTLLQNRVRGLTPTAKGFRRFAAYA
jgi:REP element-mobilizing transposase RayT